MPNTKNLKFPIVVQPFEQIGRYLHYLYGACLLAMQKKNGIKKAVV